MSKVSRDTHRRLRRQIRTVLAALRPRRWDADAIAAELNGWTIQRRRFGAATVRDPRFDQLRRSREPVPESVRQSMASGR